MPVAEAPLNPVLESPDFGRLMVFTVLAVAALWALFLVLTVVRYWSQRAQKRGNATGGLDLATLQRQRDAGNISQEEYERIRGTMTGARPASGANAEAIKAKTAESEETSPERPINPSGGPVATGDSTWRDGRPGRSESNGQG
ncbi:MAG: hypothetical protein WBD75_00440 [Phycisphaerae bacterium]